jgi:hypothetical protein
VAIDLIELNAEGKRATDSGSEEQLPCRAGRGEQPAQKIAKRKKERGIPDNVGEDVDKVFWRTEIFSGRNPLDVFPVRVTHKVAQGQYPHHKNKHNPEDKAAQV